MELENFIQFIKSFEPNDWVVMVSAIISAGSAFYLGYKNKKFEEKWKQKQIDADLVAKSRIQWMQEARKHTADLISLYYKILNEDNQNEIYKLISLAREKNELLILYFGPEKGENQYIKENDKDILMNEFNNKGKNVYIINFLERLFYDFLKYYKNGIKPKQKYLRKQLKNAEKELYSNLLEPQHVIDYEYDEYGNEKPIYSIPLLDPKLEIQMKKIEDNLIVTNKEIRELQQSIKYFRDIMRLYLKIEWRKAKRGE